MVNGPAGGVDLPDGAAARPVPWRDAWRLAAGAGPGIAAAHYLLLVGQAALPLAGLFAMQWLVDAVASGLTTRDPDAFARVLTAVGLAAAVALIGHLVRAVLVVVAEEHGRRIADAAQQRFEQHAGGLDLADYDRVRFHELLHQAGAAAGQRPVRFGQDLGGLLSAVVTLGLMATVLGLLAAWLPLLVMAAAVPLAWTRRRQAAERYRWQHEHGGDQRDLGYLAGVLTGRATAKDVRALGLRDALRDRLAALRARLRRSRQRLALRTSRAELAVAVLASAALFGAYAWLGREALAGGITLGGLVLHAQAAQRAQNGMRDLLAAAAALGEDRLFLRPLADFLARRGTLESAAGPAAAPTAAVPLVAARLGFRYPEGPRPALADVDFTIAAGEHVALAGANGSGKSTLVKLLARLYDPTTGSLTAGGCDLRQLPAAAWRAQVAVLFQDANSFETTLGENLGFAPGAGPDQAAVWQALDVVGLADTVRALPNGLATPLSRRHPGGIAWSGGELRRLLLARALAQPAALLLLDEPFAQLDGTVADRLARELQARRGRQTIVVADHRPAAVRAADRVLWLAAGRLVGAGPAAELAARDGSFRALFPEA